MTEDRNERQSPNGSTYRSYLLRLWQEAPGSTERVVLQDILGDEARGFASLESLFAYLDAVRGHVEGGEDGGLELSADDDLAQGK